MASRSLHDLVLGQGNLETSPLAWKVTLRWRPRPEVAFEIDDVATLFQPAGQREPALLTVTREQAVAARMPTAFP